MEISFTNLKRLIIDIHIEGISPRYTKLKMDFIIGDSIDKAKEWCEKNGHVITHEINRTQFSHFCTKISVKGNGKLYALES